MLLFSRVPERAGNIRLEVIRFVLRMQAAYGFVEFYTSRLN